jgi:hypothetical protein
LAATFLVSVKDTLRQDFPEQPPHTIQRIAELILYPKREYRFLPSYLQALNRVVSVSSNTSMFPLPHTTLGGSGLLLNGTSAIPEPALGSDESLGGALLTPIPWVTRNSPSSDIDRDSQASAQRLQDQQALAPPDGDMELQTERKEIVEGPNGTGSIETVSVVNGGLTGSGGAGSAVGSSSSLLTSTGSTDGSIEAGLRAEGAVTQGELIRLEQQAGVVPVAARGFRPGSDDESDMADGDFDDVAGAAVEDEIPHARGPEEIGIEDTGPQTGQGGVSGIIARTDRDTNDPVDNAAKDTKDDSGAEPDIPMNHTGNAEADPDQKPKETDS